jgi:two-component system chemotaxis response regulator CheB
MRPLDAMSTQTCPVCGSGLWESAHLQEMQYRCEFGHIFTASTLVCEQSVKTSNLIWVALRALHEKQTLSMRLASDVMAHGWAERAEEYALAANVGRSHSEKVRQVLGALDAVGFEDMGIARPLARVEAS